MTPHQPSRMRCLIRACWLAVLICLIPALAGAQIADVTKRDGTWAQAYAGRAADPAVRFGQLANGMRYAIQHNATPANNAGCILPSATSSAIAEMMPVMCKVY